MAKLIHIYTWRLKSLKLSPHQKEAPLAYDDKQLSVRAVSYRGEGGDGGMLNPHDKALPSVCPSRTCHLPAEVRGESHSTLLVISQAWEAQSSTLLSTPKISWWCWSTALCPHCPPFTELPLPPGLRVVNGVAQFLIVPIFASVNSRLYNCHHKTKTYFTTRHPLSAKNETASDMCREWHTLTMNTSQLMVEYVKVLRNMIKMTKKRSYLGLLCWQLWADDEIGGKNRRNIVVAKNRFVQPHELIIGGN